MKILAISGSYHKEGVINSLVDKAIAGVREIYPNAQIEKIKLVEKKIEYCRGCHTCYKSDPDKEMGTCVINDDMQELYKKLNEAQGYIFATPIYIGTVTALMKSFWERFIWVLARPGLKPIKGCPEPRAKEKKWAVLIMSTGVIPNIFRIFCDDATKFIKDNLSCSLNAKLLGSVYAGAVGVDNLKADRYFIDSFNLGKKLGKKIIENG